MPDVSRATFSLAVQPEEDRGNEVSAAILGEELIAMSSLLGAAAVALRGRDARAA